MHTAFISHPDCLLHAMGAYHPECPARLQAIEDELAACGLMDKLVRYSAPLVTHQQLKRVHTSEHIASLEAAAARASSAGLAYLDPDTAMNRYSLKAAYRAAGAESWRPTW
jgi:acetoin utilization deacetylase AcuC-like enzyme